MTGEVNGIGAGAVHITESTRKQEPAEPDGASSQPVPPPSDEVTLTDAATRIKALEGHAGDFPVIDPARVEAVRNALNEGRLQVDSGEVAKKLVRLEKAVLDSLKG